MITAKLFIDGILVSGDITFKLPPGIRLRQTDPRADNELAVELTLPEGEVLTCRSRLR